MQRDKMNDLFHKALNPLLAIIQDFLSQSGYNFILFGKIGDSNIEINKITHTTTLNIKEKITQELLLVTIIDLIAKK